MRLPPFRCRVGGIGRHVGLKILWTERSVRVQLPHSARILTLTLILDFMKIYPFFNEVLVRLVEEDEVTKGGLIVINSSAPKAYEVGDVLDIGIDCDDDVRIGERVIFQRGAGVDVSSFGADEKLRLLKDSCILASIAEG